jgi:hypothetical protein
LRPIAYGRGERWAPVQTSKYGPILKNNRPTATALTAAARQYLESELIPTLTDALLSFQTLVAANVLAIVECELRAEVKHLHREWQWLVDLLERNEPAPQLLSALQQAVREGNEQLCQRIRQGT